MSEPYQQIDLEELTSSVGDRHVSRGPLPGSSEAQKMTVISGQKWLGLLKSYGLNSQLSKTCEALLTSQWGSSAAFLTWRGSGTKPCHLLLELAVSMPRTAAPASGLLPRKMAPSTNSKMWATPRTSDIASGRTLNEKGQRTSKSSNLTFGANLADQVKMWPTPQSRDWKGPSGRSLKGQESDLPNEVKMWPTPTATDNRDRGHLGLPSTKRRAAKGKQLSLSMVVSETSGSLNPTWVEWLMGFPAGWTNLTPQELQQELKTVSPDSNALETPLCRKSLNKSAEQSLKDTDK
tara:strand:+ start:653 stop:1528 length:876 start_codon:yes stop_codon:yes gene_type:complete